MANALATCYLLYFLTVDLRVADPELGLLALTGAYLAATLTTTFLAACTSDRSGRRRIYVMTGAGLQAAGAMSLFLAPSMSTAVVAAALLGTGYGSFLAVDQAIVTTVLPDAASRAKDLGIINIGYLVPQAAGPLIASVVIGELGDYGSLFVLSAFTATLATAAVRRVREVA